MNITITWELVSRAMAVLMMAGAVVGFLWKAMSHLKNIETELKLIRQELGLRYDALEARVSKLEAKDTSQ